MGLGPVDKSEGLVPGLVKKSEGLRLGQAVDKSEGLGLALSVKVRKAMGQGWGQA